MMDLCGALTFENCQAGSKMMAMASESVKNVLKQKKK